MRVAFLGLGHMGLPMARNLVGAGHDVVGFDVVPGAREAARAMIYDIHDAHLQQTLAESRQLCATPASQTLNCDLSKNEFTSCRASAEVSMQFA